MNPDESDKLLKSFQAIATSIVASSSVLTASGFVALHSHLSVYTHIPIVGVPFQFYIVAGVLLFIAVSFLVLSMWGFSQILKLEEWLGNKVKGKNPTRRSFIASVVISIAYLILCGVIFFKIFNVNDVVEYGITILVFLIPYIILLTIYSRCITEPGGSTFGKRFRKYVDNPALIFLDVRKHIIAVVALFLFLSWYSYFIAGVYGSLMYRSFPSFLSGGQPTVITIIFREGNVASEMDIPLLKGSFDQSDAVCLLIPLSDGLLVYTPLSKSAVTFKVPSDVILSIKDDKTLLDCNPPKP